MPAPKDNLPPRPAGLPPNAINLIFGLVVVVLLGLMVWLAHALTHANDAIDCATRGLRNCG